MTQVKNQTQVPLGQKVVVLVYGRNLWLAEQRTLGIFGHATGLISATDNDTSGRINAQFARVAGDFARDQFAAWPAYLQSSGHFR